MTQQWKLICKIKDIPQSGVRVVQRGLAWQELPGVAVFRTSEDRIFALLDRCADQCGQLSSGTLDGQQLVCPPHNWQVDLSTGCAIAPDQGSTRQYTVKLEDGKIYLDLAELNAPASRAEAALAGSYATIPQLAF